MFVLMAYFETANDLHRAKTLFRHGTWQQAWRYHLFTNWQSLLHHSEQHPEDLQLVLIDTGGNGTGALNKALEIRKTEPRVQILFCGPKNTDIRPLYEIDHLYFLYKPLELKEWVRALEMAAYKLSQGQRQFLFFQNQKGIHAMKKEEVLYLEKEKRVIHIHTNQGTQSFYGKFEDVIPYLDIRFCRCHLSYIVNLGQATDWQMEQFTMTNGETIPISQNRRHLVKAHYESFIEMKPYWQKQTRFSHENLK